VNAWLLIGLLTAAYLIGRAHGRASATKALTSWLDLFRGPK
jgi:hypothetical protein